MTLMELQNKLGKQIEMIENHEGDIDEARAIASLAKQMINVADITLRADKLANRHDRIDTVTGDVK